ncbi:hypothetical protein LW139_08915 [Proteus vulgaris]|uniref:hypothetical protein n=1 Tax=Proteus vulgaris TaxID=585 RepID=UPI001FFEEE7F|nr:hypothetical protein [Proteus vulgaris]UPK82791.1 hypothetical protein LW139_08915 [Proteus vulgaris]
MKQVQAMTTLVLIDGVTYQIALPKQHVSLQAKQALMFAQEFGGGIIPCTFTHIKPMEADGLPFYIGDSGAENEKV